MSLLRLVKCFLATAVTETNKQTYYSREGRIPVAARFSAPLQTDTGVHLDSCTTGTGSFPGVKRLGRGVDHQCQGCKGVGDKTLPLLCACTFTFDSYEDDITK